MKETHLLTWYAYIDNVCSIEQIQLQSPPATNDKKLRKAAKKMQVALSESRGHTHKVFWVVTTAKFCYAFATTDWYFMKEI